MTPIELPKDNWAQGTAYDAFMGRWSRQAARKFLEWLEPPPGLRWLDVGCGTGALTAQICSSAQPVSVLGCDPSAAFIEFARSQVVDERATFVAAGIEDLPGAARGLDKVVSGLVLNFLPEPETALASMKARLAPGGVIAGYVWDYAGRMDFLRVFWDEAGALDPEAQDLDEGRRFPICRREALAELFSQADLTQVGTGAIEIDTHFDTFADFWTPFLAGTGPAPSYVAALPDRNREALRMRLQQRLDPGGSGSIDLLARAWAVRGSLAQS